MPPALRVAVLTLCNDPAWWAGPLVRSAAAGHAAVTALWVPAGREPAAQQLCESQRLGPAAPAVFSGPKGLHALLAADLFACSVVDLTGADCDLHYKVLDALLKAKRGAVFSTGTPAFEPAKIAALMRLEEATERWSVAVPLRCEDAVSALRALLPQVGAVRAAAVVGGPWRQGSTARPSLDARDTLLAYMSTVRFLFSGELTALSMRQADERVVGWISARADELKIAVDIAGRPPPAVALGDCPSPPPATAGRTGRLADRPKGRNGGRGKPLPAPAVAPSPAPTDADPLACDAALHVKIHGSVGSLDLTLDAARGHFSLRRNLKNYEHPAIIPLTGPPAQLSLWLARQEDPRAGGPGPLRGLRPLDLLADVCIVDAAQCSGGGIVAFKPTSFAAA